LQIGVACLPEAYRAPVAKPNVLVVVAHPGVGGALETLLRIERRYEIRRATKLGEASGIAKTWPADVALVDAAMLSSPAHVPLGVPALVLTGSEDDGAAALARLDRGEVLSSGSRTWLTQRLPVQDAPAGVRRDTA